MSLIPFSFGSVFLPILFFINNLSKNSATVEASTLLTRAADVARPLISVFSVEFLCLKTSHAVKRPVINLYFAQELFVNLLCFTIHAMCNFRG